MAYQNSVKSLALPKGTGLIMRILGVAIFTGYLLGAKNPATAKNEVIEGNYVTYMPTSGREFVKQGAFYYELYENRGASRLVKSSEKPVTVGYGIIYIGGEYKCHSSLISSTQPGTYTKQGWQTN